MNEKKKWSIVPSTDYVPRRSTFFLFLTLVFTPLCISVAYVSFDEFENHTQIARDAQRLPTYVTLSLIKEKLDRLVDVGVSFAERPLVQRATEKAAWGDALAILQATKEKFPYIETFELYGPHGTLRATTDQASKMVGVNFADRDFYKIVSDAGGPYVSGVREATSGPKHNVIEVALPIRSEDQKQLLGILIMRVPVSVFRECVETVSCRPGEAIYVVDQNGRLVTHPQADIEKKVTDYSFAPAVQRVLRGESGVDVLADPMGNEMQLTTYAPIPFYGWGVVFFQPERTAFLERDMEVVKIVTVFAIALFLLAFTFNRTFLARKAMKEERDHQKALLESIGDGVVVIDRNWNITLWNNTASIITGWSKDEVMGKPLRTALKLLREKDRVEDVSFIEDVLKNGVIVSIPEHTLLVRKDGREIPIADSVAPVGGGGKSPEGAIIVFRDATIEQEKNHLRSDFAYASHQLRTPVSEALWNLETAIKENDPEKKKEDMRIAYQSLLHVRGLSEHLVFVSEIDQGIVFAKVTSVNLLEVLEEVCQKLVSFAEQRHVTVSVSCAKTAVMVRADRKFLSRMIFEILQNSVMYSHRDGNVEVVVTVDEKEKNVLMEVADHGIGIPDEDQTFIFTKFFRGSNHGAANMGDGLGLYLAREYATLLGAKIWFESIEEEGTKFFVLLPLE